MHHHTAICTIESITVTTTTIALWLKHRIKHQAALLTCPAEKQLTLRHSANELFQTFFRENTKIRQAWESVKLSIYLYTVPRPRLVNCQEGKESEMEKR